MKILIIEDEKPAVEKLKKALFQYDGEMEVLGTPASVQEATSWLRENPVPDLIFMDIELTDGLSFRIFESVIPSCPVIFVTAYDEYWQEAFEYNSIDYLLKPIRPEKLENAINKYKRLRQHFTLQSQVHLFREWQALTRTNGYRQRFLVKKGMEWTAVPTAEIAYCYSAYKLVFLLNAAGQKFILDRSLNELEKELDPAVFFRVNRKFLVNIHHVRKIKALLKGKLSLSLSPEAGEEVLIAQEKVAAFKAWMGN
jgi:two-component system LytT family response regulator